MAGHTSDKTWVIERIFNQLYDEESKTLTRDVVTFEDVLVAIREQNALKGKEVLSDRNPANFFKDFPRRASSANKNFPKSVFERGYTAEQVVGDGRSFRFVPIAEGQTVPFPEDQVPGLDMEAKKFQVQSLSISRAAKDLGREDENWAVQVVVNAKVVETHFALNSKRKVLQVDFLQSGVKLRHSEIDALFLLTEEGEKEGEVTYSVATCEVKGAQEQATTSQLIRQPQAYLTPDAKHEVAVPMYIQALGDGSVRVIEFEEFNKTDASEKTADDLKASSVSIVELLPHVQGLKKFPKPKKPAKPKAVKAKKVK